MGSLTSFMSAYMRRGMDNEMSSRECVRWLEDVRRVCAECLLALDFLHNVKRVVYRDLKPDNILMVGTADDFHIKLSDFGLSKVVAENALPTSRVGTVYYRAPEVIQARASESSSWLRYFQASAPSTWTMDTFSYGILLFVLLRGCDPYRQDQYGAWMKIAPPSRDKADAEASRLKWMPIDACSSKPHPVHSVSKWEVALTKLTTEAQCPKHAIQMIRNCTSLNASQRPPVTDLRNSKFFGSVELNGQETLVAVDWSRLADRL